MTDLFSHLHSLHNDYHEDLLVMEEHMNNTDRIDEGNRVLAEYYASEQYANEQAEFFETQRGSIDAQEQDEAYLAWRRRKNLTT